MRRWCKHNIREWTILAQTIPSRWKIVIDSHRAWFDRQLRRPKVNPMLDATELLSAYGSQMSWESLKSMLLLANRLNPDQSQAFVREYRLIIIETSILETSGDWDSNFERCVIDGHTQLRPGSNEFVNVLLHPEAADDIRLLEPTTGDNPWQRHYKLIACCHATDLKTAVGMIINSCITQCKSCADTSRRDWPWWLASGVCVSVCTLLPSFHIRSLYNRPVILSSNMLQDIDCPVCHASVEAPFPRTKRRKKTDTSGNTVPMDSGTQFHSTKVKISWREWGVESSAQITRTWMSRLWKDFKEFWKKIWRCFNT